MWFAFYLKAGYGQSTVLGVRGLEGGSSGPPFAFYALPAVVQGDHVDLIGDGPASNFAGGGLLHAESRPWRDSSWNGLPKTTLTAAGNDFNNDQIQSQIRE